MVYSWNQHNIVCHLYLNKEEKMGRWSQNVEIFSYKINQFCKEEQLRWWRSRGPPNLSHPLLRWKAGQNPRCDTTVEDPLSCKKKGWCLSAALFPGKRVWKPAENSDSGCRLSALYCHKLWVAEWWYDCFPVQVWQMAEVGWDLPQVEQRGSVPWESLKFGILKLSHTPLR